MAGQFPRLPVITLTRPRKPTRKAFPALSRQGHQLRASAMTDSARPANIRREVGLGREDLHNVLIRHANSGG
jgi:hypothetical protein